MEKTEFKNKLLTRTSEANADAIASALEKAGLLEKLHFLKDGRTTSVFDIADSGLVLKIFDRRLRQNERIFTSRYHLHDYYRRILKDGSENDAKGRATEVVIEIEPKLTDKGLTSFHQEMLRYKLWTDEGIEFWDIYPPASNPKEIKNVMLDHRGVPYQIDEDAAKVYPDPYRDYPPDEHGKRSDQQYLGMREDSFNLLGRSDAIPANKFQAIKEACDATQWPEDQTALFCDRINQQVLDHFVQAFESISQELAPRQWATTTNRWRSESGAVPGR